MVSEDPCNVDCDAGRSLGCRTFCCRLLVRLDPDERAPAAPGEVAKGFVDKDPEDGYCIHLDRQRWTCRIWATRPRVCRAYHCNDSAMLQAALRFPGCHSIVELSRAAVDLDPRDGATIRVPLRSAISDADPSTDES